MAWLTQVLILWVCMSVVTCYGFFGQHHHHVHHHISQLPQILASIINKHFNNGFYQSDNGNNKPESLGDGGYQLGIGNNGNPQGSYLDFNFTPSDIFGDNLFESQELIGQGNDGSSNIDSQVPGESSSDEGSFMQNPGDFTGSVGPSDEIYNDNQIPNSGILRPIDIHIPNGPDENSQGDNGGNLRPNINENPIQYNVNDGSTLEDIHTGINENNGIENGDDSNSSVAQSHEYGEATNVDGQGSSVPDSIAEDGNITENKQNTNDSLGEKPKVNVNLNLNVPGDVLDTVHVNVPNSLNSPITGAEAGTSNPKNSTLDINKPEIQINSSDIAIGVEEQKLNRESAPFQNSDNLEVEGKVHSNIFYTNSKQPLNDTKESLDGLQLAKENDNSQDGKLKTNVIVELGEGDVDVPISKRRDKHSIVFPDKLREAKEEILKEKINVNDMGATQSPNLSDTNGIVNGQFLYATMAPALTSYNQGSYVPPATSVSTGQQANYVPNNVQNVPVSGQSGTPVQYVVQNPSNAGSNIAPNSNVVYSSPSVATSSGYETVNVPNSGNNPGQVLYNLPASYNQGGQPNGYYQVNSNQSPQLYYTVQLSNGQTGLVPVSSNQMYTAGQNNGQGQVMVPSNSPQYVVSNGQPFQDNGQILVSNNGQQYIPSNGNGQIFIASNGQQYVQANSQPGQGNAQIVVPSNSQQYIQSQPANDPIMVSSNSQNYLPSGQVSVPWNGGQSAVQNSGQVYVPLNQNPEYNMVNVGGDSNAVPLMVVQGFKDKAESSSSPSSDEKLDQSKDKIDDDKSTVASKNIKD